MTKALPIGKLGHCGLNGVQKALLCERGKGRKLLGCFSFQFFRLLQQDLGIIAFPPFPPEVPELFCGHCSISGKKCHSFRKNLATEKRKTGEAPQACSANPGAAEFGTPSALIETAAGD